MLGVFLGGVLALIFSGAAFGIAWDSHVRDRAELERRLVAPGRRNLPARPRAPATYGRLVIGS